MCLLTPPSTTTFIWSYRDVAGASPGRPECTVGQYVVDLPSFENLALPLFRNVRLLSYTTPSSIDHSKQTPSPKHTHLTNHQCFDFLRIDGIIWSLQTHKFLSDSFSVRGAVWLSLTVINRACKVSPEWRLHRSCKRRCLCSHVPLSYRLEHFCNCRRSPAVCNM